MSIRRHGFAVRPALVVLLLVFCGRVAAQERATADRQKAPSVMGGTGLFNTLSTRTLSRGELRLGTSWNNYDRDPGDVDINQLRYNLTYGLSDRWEVWVDWIARQEVTSRNPFLLSGYQLNAVRGFGDPLEVFGPPEIRDGVAILRFVFDSRPLAPGGILPPIGTFGAALGFPFNTSFGSPNGLVGPLAVGLGPAIFTDRPSFQNDLPFFGEVDLLQLDRFTAFYDVRLSSSGSGDFRIGVKREIRDPKNHRFSVAAAGILKIPASQGNRERARGRTSGEYEYGPTLILGQETSNHRLRFYENFGFIHTGDIGENGLTVLDLKDKLLLAGGVSAGLHRSVELVGEVNGTILVGGGTPNLNPVNPVDLSVGLRFYFKDGAIALGGAYRRFVNHGGDRGFSVVRYLLVPPRLSPQTVVPCCDFPSVTFPERGDPNGFVGHFSIRLR